MTSLQQTTYYSLNASASTQTNCVAVTVTTATGAVIAIDVYGANGSVARLESAAAKTLAATITATVK